MSLFVCCTCDFTIEISSLFLKEYLSQEFSFDAAARDRENKNEEVSLFVCCTCDFTIEISSLFLKEYLSQEFFVFSLSV